MFGITPFGMVHTLISLVSLFGGLYALARYREIAWLRPSGRLYVWFTIATCITGFFIFRHGGFGKPHALGVITLVVLAVAWYAERRATPGSLARIVATLGYTLTLFFHFIPAFTETATRVPEGAPLVSGPDAPELQTAVGIAFAVFVIIMVFQAIRIRRERGAVPAAVRA